MNPPRHKLAVRLLLYILAWSSFVTLILTGYQLYTEYTRDVSLMDERLEHIRDGSLESITENLWLVNEDMLRVQLHGMLTLPDIHHVAIRQADGSALIEVGEVVHKHLITRSYPLQHQHRDQLIQLGSLVINASLDETYQRLRERVIIVLLSQGIKTFLVSAFILFIFQQLVTRHLFRLDRHAALIESGELDTPLVLDRESDDRTRGDELDQLVDSINHMREKLRDAHQRLRLEQQALEFRVEQRTAQLRQTNNELESFSYAVSHDLRAPLRSIHGFSDALLEDHGDQLSASARDQLQRINRSAIRMGEMIDALLEFSRITRHEVVESAVDLSAMAEEIIQSLKEREPARDVDVDIQAGMNTIGDPRLLRICLDNLLGNAWKYSANQSRAIIRLSATDTAEGRVFHLRDNGVGFDMRHSQRLFAPFQRLHGAEEFPGTGIGLATVKRIIKRHGGRIWAESETGKGAVFHFTFRPAEAERSVA